MDVDHTSCTHDAPHRTLPAGTQYSLDGTTGWQELRCWLPGGHRGAPPSGYQAVPSPEGCSLAPFSKEGWAVYEDATNLMVDPTTDWVAVENAGQSRDTSDVYMFALQVHPTMCA